MDILLLKPFRDHNRRLFAMLNASVGKDAKYQEEFEVVKLTISKVHEPEKLPSVAVIYLLTPILVLNEVLR